MSKIVAIIPAFNEEVALGSVILRTLQYVDKVIVVNDGSSDKTEDVAKLAGAEVISHSSNLGKGQGLKSGFNFVHAFNENNNYDEFFSIIVTIDGDGQNNPDEIPQLVAPIISGEADFVNGSRYLEGSKEDDTPGYRRVGQKVLDKATNISSGLNITDSQSGFRAFSKKTIPFFKLNDSGFGIESEMLSDAAEAGIKVVEVPITVRYDLDGSTENPITHGVGVLLKIIKDMELRRPLIYFTLPGFIIFLIGIISGIWFLNDYLNGTSINFGPTVIAIMLIIVGLFLMLNGILLDSIRKLINRKL
ncbi:glycosyltransferase, family 2 [Methanobrevibacter arboriphilus JCM 13429 = DSM 1125]|uniref:Glycosyltransferase, family 2 n=2 Tax=Methanobrevibacter arboriphilus TaxID=39441 RepID=A0A1V6MZY0_METAZ|nr:glycosyltransferase family 2 protein [Methanobrevibacter arboriphilus]OQD57989.1 glycosyltransferase, family 2 [Methanobrevibacter arboriphilus JCM 13429 = DSM 1125]